MTIEEQNIQLLLEELRSKEGFICDMDGVIYHGKPSASRCQRIH